MANYNVIKSTKKYQVAKCERGILYIKFIGFKNGSYPFVSIDLLSDVIDCRPKYQKEILESVKRQFYNK